MNSMFNTTSGEWLILDGTDMYSEGKLKSLKGTGNFLF